MAEAPIHWLIRWDEHDNPRGELCDCEIADSHDEHGYAVYLVEISQEG